MPIYVDISHPNRMVVAAVQGKVTAADIYAAVQKFVETGAWQYRKIIDVSIGEPSMDEKDLEALAELARRGAKDATRGPTAFVVGAVPGEFVKQFVKMTEGDRPVQMFGSIHEARKWLDENSKR